MKTKYNIISFPRSGQHLACRILKYFCQKNKIEFSYCGFYDHCRRNPCKTGKIFQKNHDFNLQLPINNEIKYLVLYRSDVVEQLDAWFRFELKTKRGNSFDYKNGDKKLAFKNFIYQKRKFLANKTRIEYYSDFLKKWVFCNKKNILKIEYNKFLKNSSVFISVFNHFFPEISNDINEKILKEFCKIEPIKKQTYTDFNF